jgi:glucose-6-phosphate isomerase
MHPDPSEIQKLTERVEALEKFKEEVRGRYIFWMIGGGLLMLYLIGVIIGNSR